MPTSSRICWLSDHRKRTGKLTMPSLVLLTICLFGQPAEAQTSTYVFDPNQSTVVQTGGFAGVHETYPIEGQFQLSADLDAGIASFDKVDANLAEPGGFLYTQSLGVLFNMTELLGTIVDDTKIRFEGKTSDGSNTDVLISLTFTGDLVHLAGQTTPPPGSADFFEYELDAVARKKYGGGTGEPNDPYRIATAKGLMLLGESPEDYNKHFILTADIDLDPNLPGRKAFDNAVIAPGTFMWGVGFQGTPFTGVFDGNGHTISHLTITGEYFLGLFGKLDAQAMISNLGLESVDVDRTGQYIGSLVGWNDGSITTSYSTGSVSGISDVGGLVGLNLGNITMSHSAGAVSGIISVGGLLGYNVGDVTGCYSTAVVTGDLNAGGLVGYSQYGSMTISHSSGTVTGDMSVGGLVGDTWRDAVTNCYSTGAVTGNFDVGGLLGINAESHVTDCYSTGTVSGESRVGGLVGYGIESIVTACFWDIQTSAQTTSDGGIGKTTAEMMTASTFLDAGWDFVSVWGIGENQTYPYLRKYSAADINKDGIVNFLDLAVLAENWLAGF